MRLQRRFGTGKSLTFEELASRSCWRNSRPIEASRIFRRGGPRISMLRATKGHLTSASPMRRANCELHCALARNWGFGKTEFFNRIGRKLRFNDSFRRRLELELPPCRCRTFPRIWPPRRRRTRIGRTHWFFFGGLLGAVSPSIRSVMLFVHDSFSTTKKSPPRPFWLLPQLPDNAPSWFMSPEDR